MLSWSAGVFARNGRASSPTPFPPGETPRGGGPGGDPGPHRGRPGPESGQALRSLLRNASRPFASGFHQGIERRFHGKHEFPNISQLRMRRK